MLFTEYHQIYRRILRLIHKEKLPMINMFILNRLRARRTKNKERQLTKNILHNFITIKYITQNYITTKTIERKRNYLISEVQV